MKKFFISKAFLLTTFFLTIASFIIALILLGIGGSQLLSLTADPNYVLQQWHHNIVYEVKFSDPFALLATGFQAIFHLQISETVNGGIVLPPYTNQAILEYQVGTIFMLIIGPSCAGIFMILLLSKVLAQKPLPQGTIVEKITATSSLDNKHADLITEHDQLLSALKDNMNQVQDYLIKLHGDIKALKKYTGLKTPKRIPTTHSEPGNDKLELENNLQQLDELKTKLQSKETNPTGNQRSVENEQSLQRPTTLIQPADYIMPKRDEKYVESFPTNQFLEPENTLSLSSIFDRKKIKAELEEKPPTIAENSPTVELTFDDNDQAETSVGLNVNRFDFNNAEDSNATQMVTHYAVGDFIFDNGIEHKIIDVKKTTLNNTTMYELTIKDRINGTVKTILKKD
ncbi:hypothetical protein [Spiroplasma sp. DGKH1]|uniref:hypothetical protein n=1 Tax=Spiroplasma sp. DGKH1 TaxID=3050074 RepID=UPI0034C5C014